LDGRAVEKLTFDVEGNRGTESLWFDRESRRPVKFQSTDSKTHFTTEATIDYPAATSIPAEQFVPTVPRDATLEINDPAFGRQVRSAGTGGLDLRQP
jgi:outer membrane lipoprotein-sorting protein